MILFHYLNVILLGAVMFLVYLLARRVFRAISKASREIIYCHIGGWICLVLAALDLHYTGNSVANAADVVGFLVLGTVGLGGVIITTIMEFEAKRET